jgi:hypothetical protein
VLVIELTSSGSDLIRYHVSSDNEAYFDDNLTHLLSLAFLVDVNKYLSNKRAYLSTADNANANHHDFGQLFGSKGNASEDAQEQNEDNDYFNDANKAQRNSNTEKMVFDTLKKNIERIVWQARITVTNKETKYSYALSTYLTNYNEQIQLQIGF